MRIPDNGGNQERILVLVPTRRDAHLSDRILTEAGFECVVQEDLDHLCRELRSGAGAVLLTDEVVENARIGVLLEYLAGQPSWSDLSLLVLAQGGVDSPRAVRALESLGNVTLLEMPVRATTLVSALRAALRARRRQYQLREHLLERERSSEALRESEERLRLALCASETGTFHQDFQSRMLACDENLLQLLGLPSDRSLDEFDRFLEL